MDIIQLVRLAARKSHVSQPKTRAVYHALVDTIYDAMKAGEDVKLFRLWEFSVRTRPSRNGVNPQTLEKMVIPEVKSVGFKVSVPLRKIVQE